MNKKPKLLIATDNFLPRWDGIARFLSEIIPYLTEDYDVTVLAPDYGSFKPENYKLVKIKKSRFGLGDYVAPKFDIRKVRREVKKADIIFSQTIGPIGFLSVIYAKKKKKKIASYIHSFEWELVPMSSNNILLRKILFPLMKFVTRFVYSKPDLLITPSKFLSDALSWRNINTRKISAKLGVDCDVFKPITERNSKDLDKIDSIKKELGLKGFFVIGNHGRLANEKDLFTLLRAFTWFKKKHKNSKLLIIGNGLDSIKEKLEKQKDCVLVSAKSNVQLYLNLMNVYVTSSLTETTSLATLEAMASGLPVISTPVGFIKEYIEKKENGLFFKQKNSFELYKQICYLKNNSDKASLMGKSARETVLKDFQWKNTALDIKEALDTL